LVKKYLFCFIAQNSFQDADYDPVKAARDERKARVAKNEKQKLANQARAPSERDQRKKEIDTTLATARISTASMGRFDKEDLREWFTMLIFCFRRDILIMSRLKVLDSDCDIHDNEIHDCVQQFYDQKYKKDHGIMTIFSHRSLARIKLCIPSIFPRENLILYTSKSCSTELSSPWNLIYIASMTQTSEYHPCAEVGPRATINCMVWTPFTQMLYIHRTLFSLQGENRPATQDLTYAIEAQHCGWAMPCKLLTSTNIVIQTAWCSWVSASPILAAFFVLLSSLLDVTEIMVLGIAYRIVGSIKAFFCNKSRFCTFSEVCASILTFCLNFCATNKVHL